MSGYKHYERRMRNMTFPDLTETKIRLETLLSGLNREQLQALLLHLVEQNPSLADMIEGQAALLHPPSPQPQPQPEAVPQAATPVPPVAPIRRPEVDPKPVRRQVRSIMRSLDRMSGSEAYGYIGAVVNGVREILDQAWTLIKADDGRNALILLEAITEEYLADWENLDDSDGEASDFFSDLGPAWTEALLSADISDKERKSWVAR